MFELYTPALFPSPFAPGFDPRDGVHEVVERHAGGELRVVSHHKRFREVPAARVAPGFEPRPGDRVSGVNESGGSVVPLEPNQQELAYAQRWLDGLTQAGLVIEGLDMHARLRERLRTVSFGVVPPRSLRAVLREWLGEVVGCYPPDDWRSGDAAGLARTLLESLGVPGFITPPPDASTNGRWTMLVQIVAAANSAMETAGSPLRWMPCERELSLSPRETRSEFARATAREPVWLVLVPAMVAALEERGILRRYRGADAPSTSATQDPRVLHARSARVAPPGTPPVETAAPPEKPCFVTVSGLFDSGGGELVAEDGRMFRFGRNACRFAPEVGMRARIVSFVAEPGGQYAAAIVLDESDRKLGMLEGVITILAYPDSPGHVLLDSGEKLRFGISAVRDFTQRIGLRVHAEELESYPLGGQRARRLNPLEKPERQQAARSRAAAAEKRALDAAIARVDQLLEHRRMPACLEDWRALARDALDASGLPRAVQKRALASARVGACLVPGPGKTRLGGVPRLPAGVAWPMTEKRPYTALAELHAAELPSTLDLPMPKEASVVLLYDPHVEHTEYGDGAAIISRGPLTEPGPAQWPELTFRAVEVLTLPAANGADLDLSGDDYTLYHNLVLSFGHKLPSPHQIGGHARDYQGAMERELGKGRWQLLAQFDSGHWSSDMMWGDGGCIYFWVRTSELKRKAICELRVLIQS